MHKTLLRCSRCNTEVRRRSW